MSTSELRAARKSLNAGRVDETLLHLWNGLEAARLGAGSERRQFEQLAATIRAHGDEGEQREAERLLAAINTDGGSAEPAWEVEESGWVSPPVAQPEESVPDSSPAPSARVPEGAAEPTGGRRAGWGRLLLPVVILLFVLVNLIARLAGGE